ncbi:MAG: ABC transporter permease, partial [Olsenella sp.]
NSIVDMNYSVDSATGDERYSEETAKLSEMSNTEGQYRFISYGTRNDAIQSSQKTSGMISYLAIYIGFVLVIACAAILAIQQLSSASDAIPSYRLLAELGCPRSMALRSLLVQTLAFFLLPLIVAVAHTVVALRQLIRIISLIGSISWTNAIVTTAVAFVAVYGAYFAITYVTSRGLVTMHSSRARE